MKNIILAIITLIFISCNQDNNQDSNLSSQTKIKFYNNKFDFFNYTSSETNLNPYNIDKNIYNESLNLNHSDFQKAVTILTNKYNLRIETDNITALIVYKNKYNSLNIDKNISGFTYISKIDNSFEMKTYSIINDKLIKIIPFTKNKKGFTNDYFAYIGYSIDNENISVFSIRDYNEVQYFEKSNDELKTGIDFIVLEQYPTILTKLQYEGDTGHFCNENDCSGDRGWCAWDDGANNIICQPSDYVEDTICARDEVKSSSTNFINNPLKETAMYYIKDVLFANSNRGSNYIDYYYKLSYAFKSAKLYKKNSTELGYFMNFVQDKAYLYFISNSNKIIIDSSEYEYLMNLIIKYQKEIDNNEYKTIFETFKTDLNFVKDKSKMEISNYFD